MKKRRSSQSVGRKMWCQSTMHYLHCTCMYAVCVPVGMYLWSVVHACIFIHRYVSEEIRTYVDVM